MGLISDNNSVQIMGLLKAAVLACKRGKYDLCMELAEKARVVDEEIWTEYLQKPEMYDMLAALSEAGAFN